MQILICLTTSFSFSDLPPEVFDVSISVTVEVITQIVARQLDVIFIELNYELVGPAQEVSRELDFFGFAPQPTYLASLFVRIITSKSL